MLSVYFSKFLELNSKFLFCTLFFWTSISYKFYYFSYLFFKLLKCFSLTAENLYEIEVQKNNVQNKNFEFNSKNLEKYTESIQNLELENGTLIKQN
jgi:hypothetical protein